MGRTPCCDKNGLKKGPWTQEEDQKLMQYIQTHGPGNWRNLPKNAGLQRCGKSCRLRWTNYLRPDIKRGRFSFEEEESIIQLHSVLGNKWSAIAARLPGRTDNEIKNYWNTHIRKRLLRMGIDPVTHSPRLDFLDLSSLINSAQLNLSNFLGLQNLVNPDVVRLATFLASNQENPEAILQKLQENQLFTQSTTIQPTQFQNPNPEVPSTLINGNMGQFSGNNMTNYGSQIFEENPVLNESHVAATNYGYFGGDQSNTNVSESSNACFDSLMSTPLSSSTPLTSSSTFVNSSTEDERESYCSKLFKFEIPESLDFDDFM